MPDLMQTREIANPHSCTESQVDGQRALETLAAKVDGPAGAHVDLSSLWSELVQGSSVVLGTFFSAKRCGVVLADVNIPPAPALEGRRLEIIELILSGASQNLVAIELALAPSTIALNARLALETLGVVGRPSRVHPLVMLAASVARNRTFAAGSLGFVRVGGQELRVVGIPRPDRRLVGVLPAAELAVVGCLLEGCCYAEIAQRRRTAERTIANQIANVFKRLRVSGRSELVQHLFALEGLVPSTLLNDSTSSQSSLPRQPSSLPPPPSTVRYPCALTANLGPQSATPDS